MGLYDSDLGISWLWDFKKMKYLLIVIVIIIGIALVYVGLNELIKPKALSLQLNKMHLKAGGEDFAALKIIVNNVTEADAEKVQVEVEATDKAGILIDSKSKASKKIELIGRTESRELGFLLRANPNEVVLPGNYTVNVRTVINGKEFQENFVMRIVK